MEAKRVRRVWWWMCISASLFALSLPFLARTTFMAVAFVGGCCALPFLALLLVTGIILLSRKGLTGRDLACGFLGVLIAGALTSPLEGVARKILFELRYPYHRKVAAHILQTEPREVEFASSKEASRTLTHSESSEAHANFGAVEYPNGKLEIRFDTGAFVTLESTRFVPLGRILPEDSTLRLVKRDDLGTWYFEVR